MSQDATDKLLEALLISQEKLLDRVDALAEQVVELKKEQTVIIRNQLEKILPNQVVIGIKLGAKTRALDSEVNQRVVH